MNTIPCTPFAPGSEYKAALLPYSGNIGRKWFRYDLSIFNKQYIVLKQPSWASFVMERFADTFAAKKGVPDIILRLEGIE